MTANTDGTTGMADLADVIRDADHDTIWTTFGEDLQEAAIDADPEPEQRVVVSLTVTPELYDHDERIEIRPAVAWAVERVDHTVDKLAEHADATVVFNTATPGTSTIRRKVARALEEA